jgi:hypothetical protein
LLANMAGELRGIAPEAINLAAHVGQSKIAVCVPNAAFKEPVTPVFC